MPQRAGEEKERAGEEKGLFATENAQAEERDAALAQAENRSQCAHHSPLEEARVAETLQSGKDPMGRHLPFAEEISWPQRNAVEGASSDPKASPICRCKSASGPAAVAPPKSGAEEVFSWAAGYHPEKTGGQAENPRARSEAEKRRQESSRDEEEVAQEKGGEEEAEEESLRLNN